VAEAGIICIGDGIGTDVQGAMGEDLDCLFISGGLAAAETKTATDPEERALGDYLAAHRAVPQFAIGYLR
jgi:ribonucleotide monophosphatase NagD (HAD superfamily)